MFSVGSIFSPALRCRCRQFFGSIAGKVSHPDVKLNKIFINNEWSESSSGNTFETIDPSTGKVIAQVARGNEEDINRAVGAAQEAFHRKAPWRTMDASQRGRLLNKLAGLIERDAFYIASLETLDSGKPFSASYHFDVPACVSVLRYYAGWADKDHGKTIAADGNVLAHTRHEPVGVCGQIIPWNVPLLMWAWKIGPALATGNTVVLKPAEQTPLTALYAAELCKEAGIPPGVVNIVPGFADAGAALARHENVDKVAFTGSTQVGKLIQQAAGDSNLKKVSLELGGKSPVIIMDDCDLQLAVEHAHISTFFNMGQSCCAGTRIYVHRKIHDKFVEESIKRARKRVVGDPFDQNTEQGPQISEEHLGRVMGYIDSGKKEGAKLVSGGNRIGNDGYFLEPTIFIEVEDNMTIAREEIFGPVQQIMTFETLDEVIDRANDSNYGLASAVFSNNINTVNLLTQALLAGIVWVNTYFTIAPQAPFGGYKMSGIGRELGEYGLEPYRQVKSIITAVPHKMS